jgi:8-hydroxy-5-deazaflavin:NADPH oxidoreductase
MRIGVIGTGKVGGSLATGFADGGHLVMLGSRDPRQARLVDWTTPDVSHRQVGTQRDAALFGEVVVIATPGRSLAELLDDVGRDAFDGKVVVDVTNPFARNEAGETVDFYGDDDSGAELLQRELSDARVVKAFNQIAAAVMLRPEESEMDMLRIAGDDEGAKRIVSGLAESFGWNVRDLGPLKRARALEHGVIRLSK